MSLALKTRTVAHFGAPMSYHATAAKSKFVVGIEEGEGALLPFDDFLIAEEAA